MNEAHGEHVECCDCPRAGGDPRAYFVSRTSLIRRVARSSRRMISDCDCLVLTLVSSCECANPGRPLVQRMKGKQARMQTLGLRLRECGAQAVQALCTPRIAEKSRKSMADGKMQKTSSGNQNEKM